MQKKDYQRALNPSIICMRGVGFCSNFLRTQLVTVPGAVVPYPCGGKQRQVMINLIPQLMQAKGISPTDVLTAVTNQNLVLPSGTAKIGEFEYDTSTNASPRAVKELNDLPIKVAGEAVIYQILCVKMASAAFS
jgi:multidrug efflux pump subunit AcrB